MKILLRLAIAIAVLLILILGGVILYIDRVAEAAIERAGTSALGTETRVDSVAIGLLSGDFALKGLAVANPPGFGEDAFLSLDGGRASLDLGSLRTDTVRVREIALDGVSIHLIRSGGGTNYGTILESAGGTGGGGPPAEAGQPGKSFVVERLRIQDVTAHVQVAAAAGKLTELEIEVPAIELENVGSEGGGVPLARLSAVVVGAVIDAVLQKRGELPAQLVADLQSRLGALARLPIQLPEVPRVPGAEPVQEAVEQEGERAVEQLGEKAGEALRGVLGGGEPETEPE